MIRALLLFGTLAILGGMTFSQIIPEDSHQELVDLAMANYWGNARLSDGSSVMPDSEEERITVPLTNKNSSDVIRAGALSGLANWCGLEWEEHFYNVTNGARKFGLSGKQVAFVGLLHGISMGTVGSAIERKTCSPEQKKTVNRWLTNISSKSINFTPSAPVIESLD